MITRGAVASVFSEVREGDDGVGPLAFREQAPLDIQQQRRAMIARTEQARESGPSRGRAWKPKMIAVQIRAVREHRLHPRRE